MSFLTGLLTLGKAAVGFMRNDSLGATLAKAAIAGFAIRKLTESQLSNEVGSNENIDGGVRLQVAPDASNKIPVLYGTAFFGSVINDAELSSDNQSMYYSMTLSEKTGTVLSTGLDSVYTFKDVYWNDQRIVFKSDGITLDYTVDRTGALDRTASGLVKVYCYSGDSTSGVVPENYTGTVPNAYNVMPSWNNSHNMTDLIFAIVKLTYSRDKNVTGLGSFNFEVSNSMKFPGDVLYDYFSNSLYGAGLSNSEIDISTLTALTTYSKTSVSYEDQGVGIGQVLDDRYQINGLLDTENNVFANIEKICNSAGSWLSYDNYLGKFGVIINKAESTVASFNDSNIISSIRIQGTGLSELYNNVKVEFPNRDILDRADYINIEIPAVDRNANELNNILNISYELINEPVQSQLLGFIELKQSRVDLLINFETDYSYINLRAGEVITVTDQTSGFSNKQFRILSINENQDGANALTTEILALEYDANVYSTADLYRYTRTNDNGIITIASIGTPGTPQVSKIEIASRPRVIIESTSPGGVVEGLEYWYTTDINEPNDDARSYTLLGTKRPTGGGTFSSGTTVVLEVDTLSNSQFYVKTRGFNDITTGPYSNFSGLVDFTPQQTTDAVGPDTSVGDGLGGLATALGLLSLLQGIDGLFSGNAGTGGLFSKIFSLFNDETGVDILGQAAGGTLAVAAQIAAKEEGTQISSAISSINFVGADVTAVASGNDITVYHGNIDQILGDPATGGSASCSLNATLFPNSFYDNLAISTSQSPTSTINRGIPPAGNIYITFSPSSFDPVADITPASGNIKIYKTDNSLMQTISASSCSINGNVVSIPYNLASGTDYYVTVDPGAFVYCSCVSQGISAGSWTFNTSSSDNNDALAPPSSSVTGLLVEAASLGSSCVDRKLTLTFNNSVVVGTGTINIKSGENIVATINASSGIANTQIITYPDILNLPADTYTIEVPVGVANTILCGSISNTAYVSTYSVNGLPMELISVVYTEKTNSELFQQDQFVNRHSQISILFNQSIIIDTTKTASIIGHQTFDLSNSLIAGANGQYLVLNPTVDLIPGQTYSISIDAGAVYGCGAVYAGGTIHNFRSDPGPSTVSFNNTTTRNGYVDVNYDRDIDIQNANVNIRDSNNNILYTIPSTSNAVTIIE
jgi:hypothetical protein